MDTIEFLMTKEELKRALEFSNDFCTGEPHGTVKFNINRSSGLGEQIIVSDRRSGEELDITEYEAL